VSPSVDTVSEGEEGGLLAHIIDSRAAARDAPALLWPGRALAGGVVPR